MTGKLKVRDRILQVAADLFYRQGYNQTGINQIIAEADIAIGSLYNHFPSKNDLLMAYLEQEDTTWFEQFEQFSRQAGTPREKILRFIDFRIEQQQHSGFCGCPFVKIIAEAGTHDPVLTAFVQSHKDKQRTMLQGYFKQVQCDDAWDRKLLCETFFLMAEGATITTTITRNMQALENVKKFIKKIIA
ncbi:TetR/AcrR family transcriptional regulator [Chitinophaga solisilvae]|uniref:TetR/AcrR family transcriptional regulator n=1 Tax=Chitinophaga solisilvae TaxID=1233460 RepID=A0A3S1D379_9BACT|nr:TetR/AcrR family transcriptional regulator [Chitinophaga solisilvae]NSL85938.1 TetR/AcrR family transcriptional regulator [Chitinophaga solisilvae]